MAKFKDIFNSIKYARRYIHNDGLKEYLWFLNSKPKYYENFPLVQSDEYYPSTSFRHMPINRQRVMSKWSHYFDIYGLYLTKYKFSEEIQNVKLLEIGVADGGSLIFWRDYFGSEARIVGVDLDPSCNELNSESCTVRIGSQSDPEFMQGVIENMGGVDIIIDDGSHINSDVINTFKNIFPLLNEGGTYIIEDVATSYWPGVYRGGFQRQGTSMEYFKSLCDTVNSSYYSKGNKGALIKDIESIHFHNSIIVILKRSMPEVTIWRNRAT